MTRLATFLLLLALGFSIQSSLRADDPGVEFALQGKHLQITIGGKPFASYVFQDGKILRPFLAHVHAPNGVQMTRNYPPIEGRDATDHDTMHPGIWLAFGDLGGADFWRNKATVKHVDFVARPKGGKGTGGFTVRNHYESEGKVICEETCQMTIWVRPAGYLLLWDSQVKARQDFALGDQEEMGLGVRVATPISVLKGGQIINSDGLKNEKQAWGKQADWCAYTGRADGKQMGVLLMPHPKNFQRCWFHARNYGLLVANPFGRNAFTGGAKSKVTVATGETMRLRFGVMLFAGEIDLTAAYQDYLRAVE